MRGIRQKERRRNFGSARQVGAGSLAWPLSTARGQLSPACSLLQVFSQVYDLRQVYDPILAHLHCAPSVAGLARKLREWAQKGKVATGACAPHGKERRKRNLAGPLQLAEDKAGLRICKMGKARLSACRSSVVPSCRRAPRMRQASHAVTNWCALLPFQQTFDSLHYSSRNSLLLRVAEFHQLPVSPCRHRSTT